MVFMRRKFPPPVAPLQATHYLSIRPDSRVTIRRERRAGPPCLVIKCSSSTGFLPHKHGLFISNKQLVGPRPEMVSYKMQRKRVLLIDPFLIIRVFIWTVWGLLGLLNRGINSHEASSLFRVVSTSFLFFISRLPNQSEFNEIITNPFQTCVGVSCLPDKLICLPLLSD